MDETRARKKLARGILQVNLVSLILGALVANFFQIVHGFVAFWISTHITSYIIYRKDRHGLFGI